MNSGISAIASVGTIGSYSGVNVLHVAARLPAPIVIITLAAPVISTKRGLRIGIFAVPQVINVTYPKHRR